MVEKEVGVEIVLYVQVATEVVDFFPLVVQCGTCGGPRNSVSPCKTCFDTLLVAAGVSG